MERDVNLSHILGKTHLSTGTVEAPRYAGQQKTSAQGKHGGPLGQHLLLLGVGREEHIIQSILMTGAAMLHSSTANDFCQSFGTVFLKALPRFCMQQPGEGPEQGLPHQPIPLPQAHGFSHTLPGDLLQNLIQLSITHWRFNTPDELLQVLSPKISSVGIF